MANPQEIVINEDVWTLVAANVNNWKIAKLDDTESYYQTYVDTGENAPSNDKRGVFWDGYYLEDSSVNAVDVYIKTINDNGLVELRNSSTTNQQSQPNFDNYQSKDFVLAVKQGMVEGHTTIDKFGVNRVLSPLTDPEDVWEYGGLYPFDINGTAPIVSLVSDNVNDSEPILITGLDINGDLVEQEITLTGTTRTALTTPLWRVFRMSNEGSNVLQGIVLCYTGLTNTPLATEVRAIIDSDHGQTLMAVYTVPKGKVGFLYRGELGVELEGNVSSLSEYAHCHYESRRYGKVFKVKKAITCMVGGNAVYQDKRSFPDVIPGLTDIKLKVIEVTQEMGIWGTFDILLIDETLFSNEYLNSIGQVGY